MFAALAISRHLQDTTGVSIQKLVRTLRTLRTVEINVGGHPISAEPTITPDAAKLIESLRTG